MGNDSNSGNNGNKNLEEILSSLKIELKKEFNFKKETKFELFDGMKIVEKRRYDDITRIVLHKNQFVLYFSYVKSRKMPYAVGTNKGEILYFKCPKEAVSTSIRIASPRVKDIEETGEEEPSYQPEISME